MPVRKYRRRTSEISCCLKYFIFSVNVLFWLAGLCILAVGVWAWNEKDMFRNLTKSSHIALDPAFILICCGTITFIIGFTGCVGALRENTCLLSMYSVFLVIILLLEICAGMMVFVLRDKGWIKEQATDGLRAFITHYREDPDQQNLIDWIQEDWLQCCGIDGPNDWDNNNYFNCSSLSVGSREACGVPFSCCKRLPNEIIRNKQCGYDVRRESNSNDMSRTINEKGCVQAGEEWVERNLIIISSTVIFSAFMQILGICFAQNLRADIFAQKSKWR
ncbi:tetraspanin-5 [Sitodiplosis mosellana]|uniref:tetraspanin-5 n=1 Tax=Sitodiplosis mosellana TaxID=263140 RepID=UPI002444D473|nr:tetraspanin-5 [Sitodiplosis mosellana]